MVDFHDHGVLRLTTEIIKANIKSKWATNWIPIHGFNFLFINFKLIFSNVKLISTQDELWYSHMKQKQYVWILVKSFVKYFLVISST